MRKAVGSTYHKHNILSRVVVPEDLGESVRKALLEGEISAEEQIEDGKVIIDATAVKLEKQLMDGSLTVQQLPEQWNRLYKEYLGVDVPSDAEGCLQDSHWSGGMIGYFPSYALGSAYGAQMKHVMEADIGPIAAFVAKGDIAPITAWLREQIHRFGNFKKPAAIFEDACGKFDPKYFADYLTEKYSKIYGL